MSTERQSTPGPHWIVIHAEAYARAADLARDRYQAVMPDYRSLMATPRLDGYVEYLNWITAIRRMCRVAAAAKAYYDPARAGLIAAAVDAFEKSVNCRDATHVRDVLEHADDYAAGIGQQKIRFPDIDMDAWTSAVQRFSAELLQALKRDKLPPGRPPAQSPS